ncbi:hypothetical protein CBS101457_004827 [Exobasidium rhododendri]|nr:hypothetical protein CBS101457_004827 [Exobasidium rhododendri]
MGLFSKPKAAATLAPVPFPIGVYGRFTQHPQQIALRVRERKVSITGDDFAVKDAVSGQTMFQVHGKVFSISDKKDVQDAQGRALFTLRKKHLALRSTYQGLDPQNGKVIFVVESALIAIGTKLTAKFTNSAGNGQDMTLHLKGDLFDRSAEITTAEGIPVARIARSFLNAGQLFFDQQTYVLTIAPGVDASLLLAICICLDEKANEK